MINQDKLAHTNANLLKDELFLKVNTYLENFLSKPPQQSVSNFWFGF